MAYEYGEENSRRDKEISSQCEGGKFYMAKFLGGNGDNNPDMIDKFARPYKFQGEKGRTGVFRDAQIENGKIRCRWYQTPHTFEVGKEISEDKVFKMLKQEVAMWGEESKRIKEAKVLANEIHSKRSEQLWATV